ncbi:isopropanol dehydrogenase [Fusarium tjaetaba]|uniref:Isopropanol dehydrogenase n=1 Tax=Fusarium tjaetaba TaxID=1567544 RepID=A0A8H5SGX9_9HYPO|nr:isopropanol dehydrogenase [Fusarium tjaetaba]KAF5651418.1 isopropanol dehydrogenase [Fusarium tjaetaba]
MANPSTQRAVVLEEFGKPVSIVNNRPIPEAIPGSVVVKVFAAPLPRYIQSFYDGTIPAPALTPPFVPNPGALGRVHKVGSGAAKIKEGDLVYVSTAILGRDDPNTFIMTGHVKGLPGPNTDRLAEGDFRDGSFQQYQRAPLENAYPINERRIKELVFEAGDIKISDTVVIGPSGGTFGGNTVEVALAVGANVIALGRDAEMLGDLKSRLKSPRLTTVLMTGDVEADAGKIIAATPGGEGVDVYNDWSPGGAQGAPYLPAAEHALKRGGRIVLSGGAFGPAEVPYISVVFKKLKVEGSWMCNRQSMERIIRMIEDGRIDLGPESGVQVNRFQLDEVCDAIKHAEENTRWRNITVVAPNMYNG